MSVFNRRHRRAIADGKLDVSLDARPRRTPELDVDKITTARAAMKALRRALDRQGKRVRDNGGEVLQVQLLGQATAAAEWPKLLAYWQQRHSSGTVKWPRRVDPGAWVLNLWPLPEGSAGRARGVGGDVGMRQPTKMHGAPALTVFNPQRTGTNAAVALAGSFPNRKTSR